MEKEVILSFLTTIIEDGKQKKITNQEIYTSIQKYAKYLSKQKLADSETIKHILNIAKEYGEPTMSKTAETKAVESEVALDSCFGRGRSIGGRSC